MKTIAKQLATGTILIVLLLAANLNAEASKKKALNIETTETALQMENWMTDKMIWNTNSTSIADFTLESDADLQLENWMIRSENWNVNSMLSEDAETELRLEGWMTDVTTWKVNSIENEPELKIESWMVNREIWK